MRERCPITKRLMMGILTAGMILSAMGGLQVQASDSTEQATEAGAATKTFTDSAGREVEVPVQIDRIIPSGDMAQMFIWPLASDKLATVSTKLTDEQKKYLGDSTDGLPETGNLYKTGSELNVEEVAAQAPDIIIDFGEPKDTIVEDLDSLQNLLGIPCVFIEGSLKDTADSYRMLGDLLGEEKQAEELAEYIEEVVHTTDDVLSSTDKKSAVVLNGTDGLGCIAKGTYFDEIWSYLVDNVAEVDQPQMYASSGIDVEQLANWDPDYLFFYNSEDPEKIVDADTWKSLKAVQDGNYYGVPGTPYNFVSPPSINRYLGMVWIAKTVYPDSFDWNLEDMVKKYYKLFYHYDLSDEDYQTVMNTIG